jgi:UDP-GlcNAc:undecaprenyl-phosphate/decaprenyl-phosphate GlcNAc-1-phosphate transferase
VAGFLYLLEFRVEVLANPFGEPIALGWLSLPFTLLWIVGVINAMNLIDGLDGLAGGVALVAVVTTFVISIQRGHPLMMLFSSALAGAIVGFLFYNFNPASIFMGDTGSMFLGFVLSTTAIQTNQKASTAVAVMIPGIALGLPIMDTLLALARRAVRGRPLFQADREHIHHRLLASGLSHKQAVLVLYGLCVVLGAVALILTFANSMQSSMLLLALAVVAFVFLRALGYMRFSAVRVTVIDRKRYRAMRAAIHALGKRLEQVSGLDQMWPIVIETSHLFGATSARLVLESVPGNEVDTPTTFSHGIGEETVGTFRYQFIVPGSKGPDRILELGWNDGRSQIDRDTEVAVGVFCEFLATGLEAAKEPATGTARRPSATEPRA